MGGGTGSGERRRRLQTGYDTHLTVTDVLGGASGWGCGKGREEEGGGGCGRGMILT